MGMAKKVKGFMCNSPSSTAVCMPQDRQVRLVKSAKYIRLGEQRASRMIMRSFHVSNQEKKASPREAINIAASLAISDPASQVVVMRVSIHCEGCAGKVKKHLSRMEGVTSFTVDLESKRVTVIGHVSPSGLLESISKVKKAELI